MRPHPPHIKTPLATLLGVLALALGTQALAPAGASAVGSVGPCKPVAGFTDRWETHSGGPCILIPDSSGEGGLVVPFEAFVISADAPSGNLGCGRNCLPDRIDGPSGGTGRENGWRGPQRIGGGTKKPTKQQVMEEKKRYESRRCLGLQNTLNEWHIRVLMAGSKLQDLATWFGESLVHLSQLKHERAKLLHGLFPNGAKLKRYIRDRFPKEALLGATSWPSGVVSFFWAYYEYFEFSHEEMFEKARLAGQIEQLGGELTDVDWVKEAEAILRLKREIPNYEKEWKELGCKDKVPVDTGHL